MAIRLLVTARDVAAALHLVEVARAAVRDSRFDPIVVAQQPAAQRFADAGVDVRIVNWPSATSGTSEAALDLRRNAAQLLADINPDVVLTGLSTPFDAGLDEAVLAEARVATFLYQDFWGEQNLVLGRGADHILAIDDQAAERNLSRFGKPSTVVGSARHAAYAGLDVVARRAGVRATLGLAAGERVIGFFGQALHALPGYRRTVQRVIEGIMPIAGARLILRPHPREDAGQRQQTESMFATAGLEVTVLAGGPVEDALAACDVVVSLFSICTFDTAYLNRFAAEPIAVPMSMLFDEEIAAYCRQHGNYFDFAHHTLGLVTPVYDSAQVPAKLVEALSPASRREAWERAHRYLPDPAKAPQRVLDHIERAVASQSRG